MNNNDEKLTGQSVDLLFLGNFVHQIVNPLSGIAGTLDNLYDGTVGAEHLKQRLNAARAQLEQCISLIKNLAFFSEVSSDQRLLPGPVGERVAILPQVIIEAAQFYQEHGQKRAIGIELSDRATQYRILGRPEALKQIFMNIFDNGIKYGKPNNVISVIPRVQKKNRALVVEISNVSIGFSNHDAKKLFELGYRSPEARGSIALGTGLGLYICKRIVEEFFEGTIEALHSPKTEETTFILKFPSHRWTLT